MNYWTEASLELANQKNYLDLLYRVYPISPNMRREIEVKVWKEVETAFKNKNNKLLISNLISLDLFPLKDSYVGYLRKDPSAIERNPLTVDRLSGELYEMGLKEIYDKCTLPKETNRQIGPMFKEWISKGSLGIKVFNNSEQFWNSKENGILNVSDNEMKIYAGLYLGYQKDKGLDFIARMNNIYVIGETKFITDFGGHQDRQFDDAIGTLNTELKGGLLNNCKVEKIAILDGVLYISGKHKYARFMKNNPNAIIISSFVQYQMM